MAKSRSADSLLQVPNLGPGPGDLVDGRYLLKSQVGKGGFGTVFSALDQRTGDTVAVKMLQPDAALDRSARMLFDQEIEVPSHLRGVSGLVEIIDHGQDVNGVPYYTMPLLKGRSMFKARKGMPEQAVVNTLGRVLDTLEQVHDRGVVHKDLKPDNIFLTQDGPKVIDFGLAQIPWRPMLAAGGGTPGFMSPEQARGERVGPQADVYSMGATAYDMLAGFPPAEKEKGQRCPNWPLSVMAPDVPKDIAGIVDRALECDPRKRYKDAGEMLKVLRPHVQDAIIRREAQTARPGVAAVSNGDSDLGTLAKVAAVMLLVGGGVGVAVALKRA